MEKPSQHQTTSAADKEEDHISKLPDDILVQILSYRTLMSTVSLCPYRTLMSASSPANSRT
jgi:hypothetical protein